MGQQASLGARALLIIEALRSHSDTPHSVGLFWTRDQPDAETSTWQHTTFMRDKSSRPAAEFEPAIQASKRPQNNALDRRDTGMGHSQYYTGLN